MVAAHGTDLSAAEKAGFKTAFLRQLFEWGPLGEPEWMKSEMGFTYVAEDFNDLADQLGCSSGEKKPAIEIAGSAAIQPAIRTGQSTI